MNGDSPHSAAYEARIREARREENERCAEIAQEAGDKAKGYGTSEWLAFARGAWWVSDEIRRAAVREAHRPALESPGDPQRRIHDLEAALRAATEALKPVIGFTQPVYSGTVWSDTQVAETYTAARKTYAILVETAPKSVADGHQDHNSRRF
jgi:hypothetical protein